MNQQSKKYFLSNAVGLALSLLVLPAWSASGVIQDINYNTETNQLIIDTSSPVVAMVNTFTVSGQRRAIIDLDNAEIGLSLAKDKVLLDKLTQFIPNLKNLTVNQYGGNGRPIVRVLLDLTGNVSDIRLLQTTGKHVSIRLLPDVTKTAPSNSAAEVIYAKAPLPKPIPEVAVKKESSSVSDEELRHGLLALNQRYEALLEENRQLKQQYQSKKSESGYNNLATIEDLRIKLADMEALQIELQKNYNAVKEENALLKPAMSKTNHYVKTLTEENSALKERLSKETMHASKPAVEPIQLKVLQGQISQLTAEKSKLKDTILKLQSDNTAISRQLKQQQELRSSTNHSNTEEFAQLRQQLQIAKTTLQQSVETINGQNKEIAYLQNQVSAVKEGLQASTQEQITKLESDNLSLSQRLNEKENEISGYKKAAEQMSLELNSVKEQVKLLQPSPAGQLAEMKAVQEALQQKNDELAALEKKYKNAQLEADKAQREMKELKVSTSTPAQSDGKAKAQLAILKKEQKQREEQLNSLQQQNRTLQQELSSTKKVIENSGSPNTQALLDAAKSFSVAEEAMKQNDIVKALDRYKTAVLLSPDNFEYHSAYSNVLLKDNQYAEAIDTLKKYLQKHPASRDAYSQLGKLYLLDDQPEIATQIFSQAISTGVLNNYGTALKKMGKTEDAENVFKVALKLTPKDSELLFNLGNLYNAQNKLEKARNKYLEAIDLSPGFAEAHYNLGLIFSKMGDKPSAIKHLKMFLDLSPNVKNASTIRNYIDKLRS